MEDGRSSSPHAMGLAVDTIAILRASGGGVPLGSASKETVCLRRPQTVSASTDWEHRMQKQPDDDYDDDDDDDDDDNEDDDDHDDEKMMMSSGSEPRAPSHLPDTWSCP